MPQLPLDDEPSGRNGSLASNITAFAKKWLRLNGPDVIVLLIIGGLSLTIYHAPVPINRTFPITFNGTGDIVYPQWGYPDRGWILPSWLAGLISISIPIAIYLVAQIRIKSAWDASNAIMGTVWAVTLGSLFQVTIKQLIGGFRPYFLDVCKPDISLAKTHNETGLNGVGFHQIMYSTEICTERDQSKLKNAITSFPSGHSTAAFAGFIFLFLWMNAKLKVWADHKPRFWKLTLTMMPLWAAVMIACSLTIDAAHNWYDIVGGSVIGTIMAIASYRSTYASLLDWRFNHLPLEEKEPFEYAEGGGGEEAVLPFTNAAGWGTRRAWLEEHSGAAQAGSSSGFLTEREQVLMRRDTGETAVEGTQKRSSKQRGPN